MAQPRANTNTDEYFVKEEVVACGKTHTLKQNEQEKKREQKKKMNETKLTHAIYFTRLYKN